MEFRKRPRLDDGGGASSKPPSALAIPSSSSAASASPTVHLLESELRALRTELSHSQSLRSLERKSASKAEARLKRQLADAAEETLEQRELVDTLRGKVEDHGRQMEEARAEWMERIRWYEERWEEVEAERDEEEGEEGEGGKCDLLQQRLDAAMDQVRELERSLEEAEEGRAAAEERATEAEAKASETKTTNAVEESKAEVPRELRIKVAETERANRELRRQNEAMQGRVQEMIQHKERAASSQRRVQQLEKEVQQLTRQLEEGTEAQLRWRQFRKEIVEEGLVGEEDASTSVGGGSAIPPEISTVVRKFQAFKRQAREQDDEIARLAQLSEAHLRRCKVLEAQASEKAQTIAALEKKVAQQEAAMGQLDLENRKIVAQQQIWKRESEGMRSLLNTYEQQETVQSKSPTKKANPDGLQLSLDSAREEVTLLSDANKKLEATVEDLQAAQQTATAEHERVLEKFGKLRTALLEERAKAESAEARACAAETLAGKGSYNEDTTRVVHLQSNPLSDALRAKYQSEIDALKRQLEEADSHGGDKTTTPAPSKDRGSFGSASSRDSAAVDVQKLHSRLKEQFRNQIALFRQGVYLLTGYKIDMAQGENDCQVFTVRSLYGEREEDHLVFKWNPKRKNKLDMLNTDMAHVLMKGPSGIYVTEHGSWPGFMASVTLQLFDQQTV